MDVRILLLTGVCCAGLIPQPCPIHFKCKCTTQMIDCSGLGLTKCLDFSSSLFKAVTDINFSNNRITEIEDCEYLPQHLRSLDLSSNHLVYNRSTFHKNVFRNLSFLQDLNIGSNVCRGGEYPDDAFEKLINLKSLTIDWIQSAPFREGFSKLKHLKTLKLVYCYIEGISTDYFENLKHVENLNFSAGKYYQINPLLPYLGWIEDGAMSRFQNLTILDMSYHVMLGLCAFRNITRDLQHTKIEILAARKIQCPYGLSTFLTIDDLQPLQHTQLRELYLDENRLEMAEDYAGSYLPASLEILSLTYNRLRLEKYKTDGIFYLTGLHSLYLSYQDQPDMYNFADWFICQDFKKTMKCISDRTSIGKFDSSNEDEKRQYQIISDWPPYNPTPTNCNFDPKQHYLMIIPPYTKLVKFEQSHLGDTIFPQFVSNDSLQEIYLKGNDFQYFLGPVCNVSKVTILDLSDNMCLNVSSYFFIGFESLQELYLQRNQLGGVINRFQEGELFQNQSDLRILNMAFNRIQTLPLDLLMHVYKLEVLNLSNNLLTNFNLTISHLTNLKLLDLSSNQITFLSDSSVHMFNDFVSAGLNIRINLSDNNFECSCDSFSFLRWCNKHKYMLELYDKYTCKYSENNENKILGLSEAVLKFQKICVSKIGIIVAVSACIILMLGITVGAILYRYRWHMRYWFYVAKRKYMNNYEPLRDFNNFPFDAFVSYADSDRHFVFTDMVEDLENGYGRTLCVHHRDFIPGSDIADNIINAIHRSRKTICLLSRAFLKSDWCKYELQMAQIEGIVSRDGENIIIIVMLEDIPENELPNRIVEIMRDVTYVPFYDFNQHREDICKNLNTALAH